MTSSAYSQSFVIEDSQTVTTTKTMAGASEVGIVKAGGAIKTTAGGVQAIVANGPYATIVNSGLVSTSTFNT
ncbi:hypothetical protein [Devosia sp. UYZn731]|uniref:hypothetical protein n=1 Tax=Devosia sp. UYZn731 TaxID=3156345 RepID=UPI0033988922